MHPSTILSLLFLLLPLTLSHSPLPRRQTSSNSTLAGEIIGTDPPQPPSTNGYAINHVALQVSNITRTRAFWGDVLGLRFIFQFSIAGGETKGTNLATFMAYPFGDGEVGYQTGAEMLGELRKRDGVMEFLSYEVCRSDHLPSQPHIHLPPRPQQINPLSPPRVPTPHPSPPKPTASATSAS